MCKKKQTKSIDNPVDYSMLPENTRELCKSFAIKFEMDGYKSLHDMHNPKSYNRPLLNICRLDGSSVHGSLNYVLPVKPQIFRYSLVELYPLSTLEEYKDHRRLQVFYNKGVKCVCCDRTGVLLGKGIDSRGNAHIDLYTEDLYPLTVDHIIPKSRGGSDDLSNLQPMCSGCNSQKGNNLEGEYSINPNKQHKLKPYFHENEASANGILNKIERYMVEEATEENLQPGDYMFRRTRGRKRRRYTGVFSKLVVNPHNKRTQYMIKDNEKSMYSIQLSYKVKEEFKHLVEKELNKSEVNG